AALLPLRGTVVSAVRSSSCRRTSRMRIGITANMEKSRTDAIAVVGLACLEANHHERRKVEFCDGGYLWLGDTTMFWRSHQTDTASMEVYEQLRHELKNQVGDYEDVDVIISSGPDL